MPSFVFQDLSIYTPSTFIVFRSICNDFFEELAFRVSRESWWTRERELETSIRTARPRFLPNNRIFSFQSPFWSGFRSIENMYWYAHMHMCLEFLGVWTNVWYFQESSSSLEEWLSTNGWSWRFLSHLLFSRYKFCRPVFRRMRATTVGEITLIWFNNFTFLFIWEPCFGLRSSRSFCDALQPLRTFSWLTTTVLYSLTLILGIVAELSCGGMFYMKLICLLFV